MKLGRRHLIASLVILAASIVWNVWVFTQPDAARPRPVRQNDAQVPLLGSPAASGGAPGAGFVDPASIPPPPPLDLTREPVWIRNPFAQITAATAAPSSAPAAAPAPVVAEPVVGVILFSGDGRHSAIIDGRVVVAGDRVRDAVIISIQRDAVILQRPSGERVRLPLRSSGGFE